MIYAYGVFRTVTSMSKAMQRPKGYKETWESEQHGILSSPRQLR